MPPADGIRPPAASEHELHARIDIRFTDTDIVARVSQTTDVTEN